MMTDSSRTADELIEYFSENMDQLDPLLDPGIWENSEGQDFDASAVQIQDTHNSGFMNNIPSATGTLPSVCRLAGDYNFTAWISPDSGPDCLYSADLNKIYVNINKNIPVQFQLNPNGLGLYIRALVVYISSSDQQEPVIRCITHAATDINDGKDDLAAHVLRCASTNAALYSRDESSGRYSVCVPVEVPQCGMESFIVCYKFTCLNSCQLRNRRGMGIIFTLENKAGEVLGRHFMNVRVCSCPKRDKEKEEKKITDGNKIKERVPATKRPLKTAEAQKSPNKVVKLEPGESEIIKIPIKPCNIKELAKFASDILYRDAGKQSRPLSDQDKALIALYNSIIETPEEDLLGKPL